jgi:hypothetical protein
MKRRKLMPFRNTRSLFVWAAARRAAASIAQNTVAPLMERLGKTGARTCACDADKPAWRQRSRDEMQAQDEQDMFDAQTVNLPSGSSRHQQTNARDQPLDSVGETP